MQKFEIGTGAFITLIYDGENQRSRVRGNFIGVVFIPPEGGYEAHCVNGDWGQFETEASAIDFVQEGWALL